MCVCVRVRACVRACVRAYVYVCVCVSTLIPMDSSQYWNCFAGYMPLSFRDSVLVPILKVSEDATDGSNYSLIVP